MRSAIFRLMWETRGKAQLSALRFSTCPHVLISVRDTHLLLDFHGHWALWEAGGEGDLSQIFKNPVVLNKIDGGPMCKVLKTKLSKNR